MSTHGRIAIDTSVAIPLLVASHEAHDSVAQWAANRSLCLSGHALPETYAVLTRLPGGARVSPRDAVLATRDARALATYDAIGVTVELIED